jgi:hypothetical protein
LERVQEDEEDDDYTTYQPELPQIPMETNVSDFLYPERLGLIMYASGSDRCEHMRIYLPCVAIG